MSSFTDNLKISSKLINSPALKTIALQSDMLRQATQFSSLERLRDSVSVLSANRLMAQMKPLMEQQSYFSAIQKQIDLAYGPYMSAVKQLTETTLRWQNLLATEKMISAFPTIDIDKFTHFSELFKANIAEIQNIGADFSANDFEQYCEEEEITPETVSETVDTILQEAANSKITIPDRIDKIKRTNWYFALSIIFMIVTFIGKPVLDHATDKILEESGITELWEESGIYDWIDRWLGGLSEDTAISEEEAKAAVSHDESNISKQKRDALLAKISAIRAYIAAAPQDENTGNLLTYLSDLEKEVGAKKFGLVFEEHREAIDEVLETHTPVLTEEPDLFLDHGGEVNFLLEGDNLAALKLLEKTHLGRIDLIYIDPPYNTGHKDFVYDDCFVDAQDTFRHSKWLSFMSKRLELAKGLLSDKGVIFISIDDHECAALKILCDEIFDESCFVADIAWQRTYSTRNDSKGIGREVEHILVYSCLPDWNPNKLLRTQEMNSKYKNPDNDVADWRTDNPYAPSAATHQGMVYAIQHPFTGKYLYPTNGRCWPFEQAQILEIMCGWCPYELRDIHDEKKRATVCGVPENEVRPGVQAIVLSEPLEISATKAKMVYDRGQWPRFFFTKGGKGGIARKTYLENVGDRLPTNLWPFEEVGHTDEAKKEIGKILEDLTAFSTPKPVRLMDRILTIASNPDSIILDFFAGSGTTGHAVMAHNAAEPGSRRKFILCTNNEHDICRNVTYERLKRVIEANSYQASLKYQVVEYIPITERLYYEYADELLRHVRELVELENGINFTGNAEIAIILTDEELADFIAHPEDFSKCHTIYLGHDILPTGEQEELLRNREIQIHVIPDYYYRELEG